MLKFRLNRPTAQPDTFSSRLPSPGRISRWRGEAAPFAPFIRGALPLPSVPEPGRVLVALGWHNGNHGAHGKIQARPSWCGGHTPAIGDEVAVLA